MLALGVARQHDSILDKQHRLYPVKYGFASIAGDDKYYISKGNSARGGHKVQSISQLFRCVMEIFGTEWKDMLAASNIACLSTGPRQDCQSNWRLLQINCNTVPEQMHIYDWGLRHRGPSGQRLALLLCTCKQRKASSKIALRNKLSTVGKALWSRGDSPMQAVSG